MSQGPGRPNVGQRSIFGGGGNPVFAQMPTYTPVTRGSEQEGGGAEPAYGGYAASPAPAQPSAASPYAMPDLQPPSYQAPPVPPPSYGGLDASSQSFTPSSYNPQSFPGQFYQPPAQPEPKFAEPKFADAGFPPASAPDARFAETSFSNQKFTEPSFAAPSFPESGLSHQTFGDVSFPEHNFDQSSPETSFAGASAFTQLEPGFDGGAAYAPTQAAPEQRFETYHDEPAPDYAMASQGAAPQQAAQSDPRRQLQAFDALYDQPPQIALGSPEPSRRAAQGFYEGERADADFLDEDQAPPPPAARGKSPLKTRSVFMVLSALLGAIALGGALAFAYKQSGGGIGNGEPPLVQADARPVKELPEQAGGKEFPHKNKLIYDRLTNGDEPEAERIVPRQEDIAVPALPPSAPDMPTPVVTTDLVSPQTTQAVDMAGGAPALAAPAEEAAPDGGPRRVKTLRVLPDGSVEQPEIETAAVAKPAPETTAATPEAAPAPTPTLAPTPVPAQQLAAVQPAAAPAASAVPSKYAVQVGAHKSQTEALAIYADIQQKNPTLLANYRPMVQKAELGSKGTMYRLRVGPVDGKTAADKLCGQLKAQGTDCFVVAQ
jgi:cell division septation protein DedD